jgi:drug/metabolite transporter (DMT)-like permease
VFIAVLARSLARRRRSIRLWSTALLGLEGVLCLRNDLVSAADAFEILL